MQNHIKALTILYELRGYIIDYLKENKSGDPIWGRPMSIIDRNIQSIEKQIKKIFFTS